MTPKLPKEYSEFRRQQILKAAWECFIEKGYSETTVREIANQMDASIGVIYNYFKGKEEILETILEWSMDTNRKIFDRMDQKNTAREAFKEYFKNNLECGPIDEVKRGARGNISMINEAFKKDKVRKTFNSFYKFLEENISKYFKEGIEKQEIKGQSDPKVMAGFFLAVIFGLQLQMALIDELASNDYIEDIKKLLFSNLWNESSISAEVEDK